ncbi:hypothetical protein ACQJBY_003055 [Aegilops geniculata]
MVAAFAVTPSSSICGVCIPTACRPEARGIVPAPRFFHSRNQANRRSATAWSLKAGLWDSLKSG